MPSIINRPWPRCVKPTSGFRGPSLGLASCGRTLCRPCLPLTQRGRSHVGLSCVAQHNSRDCPAPQPRTPVAMFVSYAKLMTLTGVMAAALLLDKKPAHASASRPQPVHNVMHTSSTSTKTKSGVWGKLKAAAGAPVGALDRLLFPDEALEFVRYSAQANTEPPVPPPASLQAPAATPAAAASSSSSDHLSRASDDTEVATPAAAAAAAEASDLEGPPASQAGALTAAALLPGSRHLVAAVSGAADRLATSLAHVSSTLSGLSPSWPAESVALGAISRLPGELPAAELGPYDATAHAAAGVGGGVSGVLTAQGGESGSAVSPELARQLVRGGYALAGLVVAVMAWQLAAAVSEASKPHPAKKFSEDDAPANGAPGGAGKAPAGTSSTAATSTTVSTPVPATRIIINIKHAPDITKTAGNLAARSEGLAPAAAEAAADALPEQLRGKNVAGPFCLRPIPQQLLQQQQQVPVIELGPNDQLPPALQGKHVVGPFCLLPQITPSLLQQQQQQGPRIRIELHPQDLQDLTITHKLGPVKAPSQQPQPQQAQQQQASGDDASLSNGQEAAGVQKEAAARRPLWLALQRPSAGPASHGHLSAAAVAAAAATAGALQAEGVSMRQAASTDTDSSSSSAPLQHMTAQDAAAASEQVMGAALAAAAAADDEIEASAEADSFEAAVQRMVINSRPPKRFSSSSTPLQPQGSSAAEDQAVSVELTQVAADSAGSDDEPLFRVSLEVTDTPATAVSESLEGRLAAQVVREALVAESCAAAAAAAAERAQITTHLIEDAIAAHSGHAPTLHTPPVGAETTAAAPAAVAAGATSADSTTGGSGTAHKAAGSAAEASWDEGVCCSMAAEVREAEVAAGLHQLTPAAAAAPQSATQEVPISWQSPAETAPAETAAPSAAGAAQAIPVSWRRVESAVPAGAVVAAGAAEQVIPVVWEALAASSAASDTPVEQEIPVSWQRSAAAAGDLVADDAVAAAYSSSSLQNLVDEAKAAEAAAAEADAARAAAAAAVARVASAKAALSAAAAGSGAVDIKQVVLEACAAEAAAEQAQAARAAAAAAVARVAAAQAAGRVPTQQQSEPVVMDDSTDEQPQTVSEDEQTRIDQLVNEAKAAEAAAAEADAARAAAAGAVARVASSRSTLVRSAVEAIAAAAADASAYGGISQIETGHVSDSEREGQSETGPATSGLVGTKSSAAAAAAARAAQAELIAEAIAAEAAAFAAEAAAGAAGSAAAAEGSAGDAAEMVKGWLSGSTTGSTPSYSPVTTNDSSSSSSVAPPPLSVSWVLGGADDSEALAQLTLLAASLGHPAIGPIGSSSSSTDADAFKDEFGVPNDEEPMTPLRGEGPAAASAAAALSTGALPEPANQQASLTDVLDAASRQQMQAASQTALQQTQARVVALYRARRAVGGAAAANTHSAATQQQQQGSGKQQTTSNGLNSAGTPDQINKRNRSSSGGKSLQLLSSQLGVSDVALALALASLGGQPDSPSGAGASNGSIDTISSSAGTASTASSVSGSDRVSAGDFEDDDVIEQITVLGSSRDPYDAAAQVIKTSNQSSSSSSITESSADAVSVLPESSGDEDDEDEYDVSSCFADRFVYPELSAIEQLHQLKRALNQMAAEDAAAAASASAAGPASKTASDSATSSTASTISSSSKPAASSSSTHAAKQSAGSRRIEVVWQTLDDEEPDAFETAVQRMLINTARPKRFTSTTSAPPAPVAKPAAAKPTGTAGTKPAAGDVKSSKPAAGAAGSSKRNSSSGSSVSVLVQRPGSKADSFDVAVQRMVTDTPKTPTKPSTDADSNGRRSRSPSPPHKGFGKVVRLGPRPQQQQQLQQRIRPSTPTVLGRVPLPRSRVFSSSSLRPLPWWEQRAAARRTQDNAPGWEGFRIPEGPATAGAPPVAETASNTAAETAVGPADPAAAVSPAASAAAAPTSIPVEWMDTPTQQKRVQLKERAGALLKQQEQQESLGTSSSAAAVAASTPGTPSKVRRLPVGWGGMGVAGNARPAWARAPKCIIEGKPAAARPLQEIEVTFEQLATEAEELVVEVSGSGPRAAGRAGFKDLAARAGFKDLSAPYAALRGDVNVSGGGPTKTQQLLQQQKQRQGQQKQREEQQGGRGGQQQSLRLRPRGFGGQQGGKSSKAPTS